MILRRSAAVLLYLLLPLFAGSALAGSPDPSPAKLVAIAAVEKNSAAVGEWGRKIWEFAEPAFQEHRSSKLLADALEQVGFRVRRGAADMPTSFVAEFGAGEPVVALLAEYDALPGLSQLDRPQQQVNPRQTAGHGCGHNLFGAAIVGAAIAAKDAMTSEKLTGTIRVYGCPAEEGGCGKAYLVRAGEFKDVDVAVHWHPGASNSAGMKSSLAIIRFRTKFTGVSAHAAGSPQLGRSALDGVELMNVGINFLREHVTSAARIHYVITNGGNRPNVVPQEAEAWYYIRAPRMSEAQAIFARAKKIAEGAAMMTETKHEIRMITGSYEILINEPLARAMDANLRYVGVPQFTAEERAFAAEVRKEFGVPSKPDEEPLATRIDPVEIGMSNGSTDVGDVSWVVPTVGLSVATTAREIPGHSWANTACAGMTIGRRGSIVAAKTLAATTIDLLERPDLLKSAQRDFRQRLGETKYATVLSDGPPPDKLDDF